MPDHEDENDPVAGFFASFPMPPGMREALDGAVAQAEMSSEANTHARLNTIESLDRETLSYVASLMGYTSQVEKVTAASVSAYHQGLFDGILWAKYHVCPSCGVVHEEQFLPGT